MLLVVVAAASAAALVTLACSSPPPKRNDLKVRDDDTGDDKRDTRSGDGRSPEEDPPLPDGTKPPGRVYAHTADTLYLFDPLIQKLTKIGPFDCMKPTDRMLDIALDRGGIMYGTSDFGFLQIDPLDASCAYIKEDLAAGYPNSLTFVPAGTVDPAQEVLVGYQFGLGGSPATTYVRIDLDGNITPIGELNDPGAAIKYHSSGDLIALIRTGKAYLTVKKLSEGGDEGNDYLAEIDPKTGRIMSILGETAHRDLFGLGQWAGTAYGFSAAGEIIGINLTTGSSTLLHTLTEDGVVGSWFGAGVTTDSPTKP